MLIRRSRKNPTLSLSCWTTSGGGISVCTAAPYPRRASTNLPTRASASPTTTSRSSARRRARPSLPGGIRFAQGPLGSLTPGRGYLGWRRGNTPSPNSSPPPVIGPPDFVGKSPQRGGLFADIIGEVDYRVGQILDAVKEAGVDDNTIVILSSDNAGGGAIPQVGPGSNGPWRGDFLNTPFEGSMRVPAIIPWPRTVPPRPPTHQIPPAAHLIP